MRLINLDNGIRNIFDKFLKRYRKEKASYLFILGRKVVNYFISFIRTRDFKFLGKEYRYFYHTYNHTWNTERAVEIPIILEKVKQKKGEILEIGNVLNHYIDLKHDVVDKYEVYPGVINEDVVDYKPNKKYDLIVSISTMEHVGWDESQKEPGKIINSINNLKKLLSRRGEMIITVPVGYNPILDSLINKGVFKECYFMRRKLFNRWIEAEWNDVKDSKFSEDARGLALIFIGNK